jgi:hypothetical protein
MSNRFIAIILIYLFSIAGALAQETVIGEGRVSIAAGDAAAVRNAAKQEALRDASLKAILDATAIDASENKYAQIVADLAKQLRDVRVLEERREGADFVTRIEVTLDRKVIKNAIRGTDLDKSIDRNFSLLLIVDEYITNSRDLNMPKEELEEFKYDAGTSFKDKSMAAAYRKSNSSTNVAASSSLNASANASGSGDRQAAKVNAQGSLNASQETSSAAAAVKQQDVEAASHEKASYKRVVKYQDTSVPVGRSMFLAAFAGNLRDYDLRLLDSTNARSQFFGDRKVSLNTLSNSAEMSKFSEFARTKAKADFLLVGNATVISADVSPATGQLTCAIQVEIKAYSTTSAELIASEGISTFASGPNIDSCAGVGTQKIARLVAPLFASRVLGYWADRAARGRQYIVELRGGALTLPVRLAFTKALRDLPGATGFDKRDDSSAMVQVTLTMKGNLDITEAVIGALMANPTFSSKELDAKSEGELLTVCLGSCATALPKEVSKGAKPPAVKKK